MSTPSRNAKALLEAGIGAIRSALEEGAVAPSEVAGASLAALGAVADWNLVTELRPEAEREAASVGPLAGVPILVKDCFVDGDRAPTLGSRATATWLEGTAEVVARLRAGGASIVGYSNLHEWMVGTTSVVSALGPIVNPRDPTLIAGGSSGGSAAAIAAGLVVGAVGTDAGGSIRIPAACCAIVGFKPSRGAVPSDGFVDDGSAVDQIGPLARTVEDVRTLFEVLAGRTLELPNPGSLRYGLAHGFLLEDVDPDVRMATQRVAALVEAQEVTLEGMEQGQPAVARFILRDVARMLESNRAGWRRLVQPQTLRVLELGSSFDDADRAKAEQVRAEASDRWTRAFEDVDVVITPTLPGRVASVRDRTVILPSGTASAEVKYVAWNAPMNLGGVPSLSLPAGRLSDGSFFNVTLTGARGNDAAVIAAGLLLQSLLA